MSWYTAFSHYISPPSFWKRFQLYIEKKKNGAMPAINFWTAFYFLYISLTLFSPTHTILTTHNFFFCHFHSPFKSYCLSSCLPKAWQSHSLLFKAMYSFCSKNKQPWLFGMTKILSSSQHLVHTQRFHSFTAAQCSCALPSATLPLSPSHFTQIFHHPLPWPLHLFGVRVSPHVKQHSRSMEGQGEPCSISLVPEMQGPF